jgi:hypothetical protein
MEAQLLGSVLIALAALSALYFVVHLYFCLRMRLGVARLELNQAESRTQWPKVSMIIPARDEAQGIEAAMLTKLAEPYPELELILVNDRSTDGTREIVERLAKEHPRVRALHIDRLPEGWLGKVHALEVGAAVVAAAEDHGADVVGVWPEFRGVSLAVDAALVGASRWVFISTRAWDAGDPSSRASLGVGAFTLVRKRALAQIGGFQALKLEVADDVGLAQLIKRETGRALALRGGPNVSLTMYPTMRSFLRGAEKGAVVVNFSAVLAALLALGLVLIELAPLAFLALPETRLLGAIAIGAAIVGSIVAADFSGFPRLRAIWWSVGALVNGFALARAGALAAAQKGLRWRDTFYPADILRAGRRWRPM